MNREIKFRAWDADNLHMIEDTEALWHYVRFDGKLHENTGVTHNTPSEEIEYSGNLIPLQFTGLFDIKGRDVYEGDILNLGPNPMNGKDDYMEVKWIADNCQFNVSKESLSDGRYVAGDIYRNPELLTL